MIASVHIADLGIVHALAALRQTPRAVSTPGLRTAQVAVAGRLGGSVVPVPNPRRVGLVAFWNDDDALDAFLTDHPLAGTLAGGWSVRLAPLRAFGTWPGLDAEIPSARVVEHEGPVGVLTLGRLRVSQSIRFFRTSNKAERAAVVAPGLVWATGLGRPPFVATCSLWESAGASSAYAFDRRDGAHPAAIEADRTQSFHHQEAFIRFRPYASQGGLAGTNPLRGDWM